MGTAPHDGNADVSAPLTKPSELPDRRVLVLLLFLMLQSKNIPGEEERQDLSFPSRIPGRAAAFAEGV